MNSTPYPLSKKIWRDLLILFAIALVVRVITALPQQEPGYFDATYYYVNAVNLAQGRGFVEDFVWNYLDNPALPPHPGNLYWMPLTSIVAVPGLLIGGESFRAAQAPFIILSALLASITYWTAFALSNQRRLRWLAGLLAVFSGFYLPYWTTTDNFTVFAVVGSLAFLFAWRGVPGSRFWVPGSELTTFGNSQFTIRYSPFSQVCLPVSLTSPAPTACSFSSPFCLLSGFTLQIANGKWQLANLKPHIPHPKSQITPYALLGYFLIMTPWFVRNWQVAGTPLPAAQWPKIEAIAVKAETAADEAARRLNLVRLGGVTSALPNVEETVQVLSSQKKYNATLIEWYLDNNQPDQAAKLLNPTPQSVQEKILWGRVRLQNGQLEEGILPENQKRRKRCSQNI